MCSGDGGTAGGRIDEGLPRVASGPDGSTAVGPGWKGSFRAGCCPALTPPPLSFRCGAAWDFSRPLVLGILNVTPDSFSDGGRFLDPGAAAQRAEELVSQGADGLDVGAESSRPGAAGVPPQEQLARLLPVLRRLRKSASLRSVPLSVDTQSAAVFQACWDEGADLLNDISALRADPALAQVAARARCPVILMHMLGSPRTMQQDPRYEDVVDEVAVFFRERLHAACAAGLAPAQLLLDPGLGFGKTVAHNCELLRRLGEFRALGRPLVVGASRKSFLGKLSGEEVPERRVSASVAAGILALAQGASVLRVHDVGPHVEALRVAAGILHPARAAP